MLRWAVEQTQKSKIYATLSGGLSQRLQLRLIVVRG
jgi:hypothetical protein